MANNKEDKNVIANAPAAQTSEMLGADTSGVQELISESTNVFTRYKNVFIGLAVLGIALGAGIAWYLDNQKTMNIEANESMFKAVYAFEQDSLDLALKGKGANFMGLQAVADEYGSTDAGKQAAFYTGAIFLKQGKFDEAIEYLQKYNNADWLVQARAYALLGDAYMEKKEYSEAESYYNKAANHHPNKFFTPAYLMKLGLAQELAGNKEAAIKSYQTIVDKYEQSAEISDAKRLLGMLGAETAE